MSILRFVLNNRIISIDFSKVDFIPSTTVLNYLRSLPGYRGTKEGCAEGDCGACTVVLGDIEDNQMKYRAVDSCLLFLPAIHGKQLITVENLAVRNGSEIKLHPVQQAMVDNYGSQCGFCTPGIVMTMFALYKSNIEITKRNITMTLAGNLCRCTGYDSIYKAALQACKNRVHDHFDANEPEVMKMLLEIQSGKQHLDILTNRQQYLLPSNLHEALHDRAAHHEAHVINGATDTAIHQNKTHEFHPVILDLSAVNELKNIHSGKDGIYVGAGVNLETFRHFAEENLPVLLPMLDVFASWQIRNVASIGGNLVTSSPIGDLIPLFIALKARLELVSKESSRWVEIEEFITGYRKNCLNIDELLKGVFIPAVESGVIFKTEKISTRRDLDISTLSLALRLKKNEAGSVEEIILAYGGMADRPKRAKLTEIFLKGKTLNVAVTEQAGDWIEKDFTPISDARAGAAYRTMAAKNWSTN